jgi:deoxyuridine 5'-triphosphate nucleotidohydrolase
MSKIFDENYFEDLTPIKSYVLGIIVFNIKKVYFNAKACELIEFNNSWEYNLPRNVENDLHTICYEIQQEYSVIKSSKIIKDICKQLNVSDLHDYHNLNICYFIKNNEKENVIEFLKAYYENYGKQYNDHICISSYCKENLEVFAEFFNIPHTFSNVFNIQQLIYKNVNMIDILGILYTKYQIRVKENMYQEFSKLLNNEQPILRLKKISENAVLPTKTNFSDVGYDISIIGLHKTLVTKTEIESVGLHKSMIKTKEYPITALYNTGIKLDIPVGYYVELVPRSSISKSGYMLANSIGIIDCSYKGELLVALTKTNANAVEIEYPFRCCQLIMKKQIFPYIVEVADLEESKRAGGGFGSSNP